MLKPRDGTVIVTPIQTHETLNGGRIIVPPKSREALTLLQMNVVAAGGVPDRGEDADDPALRAQDEAKAALQPHDWILVKHRSWIELDRDHFIVPFDAVLGRFRP